MAHIVPSISFVKTLKRHLQSGKSVGFAIDQSILEETSEFSVLVQKWKAQLGKTNQENCLPVETHYQRGLFEILRCGLDGAPIFELLADLEAEMLIEFERQWKSYLERLPLLLSLPLLLFFFPAYIILMFGPLITQFLMEVQ